MVLRIRHSPTRLVDACHKIVSGSRLVDIVGNPFPSNMRGKPCAKVQTVTGIGNPLTFNVWSYRDEASCLEGVDDGSACAANFDRVANGYEDFVTPIGDNISASAKSLARDR
jgi:hypothetical protein